MLDNQTLALLGSVLFAYGGMVWWLSDQFKKVRDFVQETADQLEKNFLEKLEYHERHDDKRFSDIVNSLWELRLRNAAIEGITTVREIKANKKANDESNGR